MSPPHNHPAAFKNYSSLASSVKMSLTTFSDKECCRFLSNRFPFSALLKQTSCEQIYAPLPAFLPVRSSAISPSGVLTIRTSSFFGFFSWHPMQILRGIFLILIIFFRILPGQVFAFGFIRCFFFGFFICFF